MIQFLEDLVAQVEALITDSTTLKGILDDYFEFTYSIKDDHIKLKLTDKYAVELDEWRQLYNNIVENKAYGLDETKGFSTMSKMVQQVLVKAVREEIEAVNQQAKVYEVKIAKGLEFLNGKVAELNEVIHNFDIDHDRLAKECFNKTKTLVQKVKGMNHEFSMIRKCLDAKLEYSPFVVDLIEEFNIKCRELNFLYYDNKLKHNIDELENGVVLIQRMSKQFYQDILNMVRNTPSIAAIIDKCLMLGYSTDPTSEITLYNKKMDLKNNLEREFGGVVLKTKNSMMESSDCFEKMYSEIMAELCDQMNKPILTQKEENLLTQKQQRLESLHEMYIKEFSPLYTFFCVDWSKSLANILIEKEKAGR